MSFIPAPWPFSTRSTAGILMLLASLVAIAVDGWKDQASEGPRFSSELADVILPESRSLRSFRLLDHHRQPFGREQLLGQWTLLFFGYTYCPDVCPTAMGILAQLFERMKQEEPLTLDRTHLVFVSVDPERDTPEHLKQYLAYFHPDFLGVTGTAPALQGLARQVGAIYFRGSEFQDPERPNRQSSPEAAEQNQLISHTSAFFLIDPLGRLVAIFPEYNNTDMIFEDYLRIRKFARIHHLYDRAPGSRPAGGAISIDW